MRMAVRFSVAVPVRMAVSRGLAEAEPDQTERSMKPHRYLVIALNSSIGARASRLAPAEGLD